ncbi:hypothetical protein ACQEU6_39595 [Spirillospora sp. CA-108201]
MSNVDAAQQQPRDTVVDGIAAPVGRRGAHAQGAAVVAVERPT